VLNALQGKVYDEMKNTVLNGGYYEKQQMEHFIYDYDCYAFVSELWIEQHAFKYAK